MRFHVPTSCSVVTTAVQNPESPSSYEDNQRNGKMDCEKYQKKFVNKDSFNATDNTNAQGKNRLKRQSQRKIPILLRNGKKKDRVQEAKNRENFP